MLIICFISFRKFLYSQFIGSISFMRTIFSNHFKVDVECNLINQRYPPKQRLLEKDTSDNEGNAPPFSLFSMAGNTGFLA